MFVDARGNHGTRGSQESPPAKRQRTQRQQHRSPPSLNAFPALFGRSTAAGVGESSNTAIRNARGAPRVARSAGHFGGGRAGRSATSLATSMNSSLAQNSTPQAHSAAAEARSQSAETVADTSSAGGKLLRRSLESVLSPIYTLFSSMGSVIDAGVSSDHEKDSANRAQTELEKRHSGFVHAGPGSGTTARGHEDRQGASYAAHRDDPSLHALSQVAVVGAAAAEDAPLASSPISNIDKAREAAAAAPSSGVALAARDTNDDEVYAFIAALPPASSIIHRPPVCLPALAKDAPPCTLALDLDETLVHCSTEELLDASLSFPVVFCDVEYRVYVRKRPHLESFLQALTSSGLFEMVVFTASHRAYADRLLDILDPQKKYFAHRVFREACVVHVGNYIKDLNVLGRDLAHTVIIDNSPQAFGFQTDNGIPISTWTQEEDDNELLELLPLLNTLARADDVRVVLRERMGLSAKVERARRQNKQRRYEPTLKARSPPNFIRRPTT